MPIPEIKYCPSLLLEGYDTYSPLAQKMLFGNRSRHVPHVLPFPSPGRNTISIRTFNEKRKGLSISGVQEKYSIRQEKNELTLTDTAGTHILKPVPVERLELIEDMPANEHLSMQLASQVFNIQTAACGMIFFEDGSPAYITKRFDYKPNGGKYQMEDFATLLEKSPIGNDTHFKYEASYLDIAAQIQQYTAAAPVALLRFFQLMVFNYLIGNGDAHLKNYSLIETAQGDFMLSPAYDLLCTALHVDDSTLALENGLYEGDYEEASYYKHGVYTATSFLAFAAKAGISKKAAGNVINHLQTRIPAAIQMIDHSFLSTAAKERYLGILQQRYHYLMLG